MNHFRLRPPDCLSLGILALVLSACGGAPPAGEPEVRETAPQTPVLLGAPPTLPPVSVDIRPGEPLEEAFERVVQAFRRENLDVFDPRRAYATSPARDFAWYFTVNDADDPAGRTNHVFFVVTEPWETDRTRDFLLSYLVMPGAPPTDAGRPWFHFYSAEPPPFAVQFLFSNTVEGTLEATLLTELGTWQWDAAHMGDVVRRVEGILERMGFEIEAGADGSCPTVLDDLYAALPHAPSEGRDDVFGRRFVPEGTLAAIGALAGDSIQRSIGEDARWEDDDETPYPRLRITGRVDGILRPISMIVEFYLAEADILPSDYCRRVLHNVIESGEDSAPRGD